MVQSKGSLRKSPLNSAGFTLVHWMKF